MTSIEHLYKVLVVGDLGSGKTSIIKRSVHNTYDHNYRSTIGVDFAVKTLIYDDENIVRLQFWDIAGQERFGNMTRVYYKNAHAVFIVFDLTRESTFQGVLRWKQDIEAKIFEDIPVILLGNKYDLFIDPHVSQAHDQVVTDFCKNSDIKAWFKTSAKDNIGIEEAINYLVKNFLNFHVQPEDTNIISVKLTEPPPDTCC